MRSAGIGLFLLATGFTCRAQDDAGYDGNYRFSTGTRQLVFSDTALVRTAPAGGVADTLYAFAAVRIRRRLPQVLTVGRKTAPWYEVTYEKAGGARSGTLWGGALALAQARRDGVDFAFSLLSYPQPPEPGAEHEPLPAGSPTCAIKARAPGSNVQQCWYNIHPESGYFLDTSRDDANKPVYERFGKAGPLPPGARFLVHFYMSGEACGIPTYRISAAWDGAQLLRMPLLEENADAGIWHYKEAYVYPGQRGGAPGLLSIRGASEEYEDADQAGAAPPKRTATWRRYRWDAAARRLVAVPETPGR